MARVFSGIQPSGELHIGNYLGAVQNWVRLQHQHDCVFSVVDLNAITQPYEPAALAQRTLDMAISLYAVGLDPERCIVFVQSHVPEHSELNWLLTTVTPLGELERQPQFKDKAKRGEGFGFPEPQALLSTAKRVLGLDGQAKMSKSLGNTIGLFETPETIWEKLKPAATDPARVTRRDPGNPDICNIFTIHQGFSPPETQALVARNCRTAGWGCLDCKRVLADNMIAALTPVRERAQELRSQPQRVGETLRAGAAKARAIARRTMERVRRRMGLLEGARA